MPDKPNKLTPEALEALEAFILATKGFSVEAKVAFEALATLTKEFDDFQKVSQKIKETLEEQGESQTNVYDRITNVLKNRLLEEEDLIEKMSYGERKMHVENLKRLQERIKIDNKGGDELIQAYIDENEFKIKIQEKTAEKVIASYKGVFSRLSVGLKESELKMIHWARQTFGASSALTKLIIKIAGTAAIVAMAFMLVLKAIDNVSKKIENAANTMLLTGGYIGKGFKDIVYSGYYMQAMLDKVTLGILESSKAFEVYETAVKAGIISVIRASYAYDKISLSQEKFMELSTKFTIDLYKMNVVMFGSVDNLEDMISMLTYFRIKMTENNKEYSVIFSKLYEMGSDFGITAQPLLNFMNVLGKTAYMTGIDVYRSIGVIDQFGKTLKKRLSAEELKTVYEALGKLVDQFDPIKYMAVMKGSEDFLDKYEKAIKDPLAGVITYVQEVGRQINVPFEKRGLALAMTLPEFKSLGPGISRQLIDAFLKIDLSRVKTEENIREELKRQKIDEHLINLGTQMLLIKDPQARLLDYVMKAGEKIISLLVIIASKITFTKETTIQERIKEKKDRFISEVKSF